ncbi:MAG: N-acetyltransferase family protein [Sphingomonas sp.]|nr:MAG: N-acetyltransferase family protein [Sphingomonas sp.]
MLIRAAFPEDAGAVAAIYAPYVRDTVITFEEDAPDAAEMAVRMAAGGALYPWLVAEDGGGLLGYVYARPYHARAAYRWTCETTIYLAQERRGRGIGRPLYAELLARLEAAGFVTAIAAITVPNAESTRFHTKLGFREAGRVTGVGFKHGAWRDVGYMQRDLAVRGAVPAEKLPRSS